MPKVNLLDRVNGHAWWLRFVTPVLIMVMLGVILRFDNKLDAVKENMVYKQDFKDAKDTLTLILNKMDDRLREVEIYGRRQIPTRFEKITRDQKKTI